MSQRKMGLELGLDRNTVMWTIKHLGLDYRPGGATTS